MWNVSYRAGMRIRYKLERLLMAHLRWERWEIEGSERALKCTHASVMCAVFPCVGLLNDVKHFPSMFGILKPIKGVYWGVQSILTDALPFKPHT